MKYKILIVLFAISLLLACSNQNTSQIKDNSEDLIDSEEYVHSNSDNLSEAQDEACSHNANDSLQILSAYDIHNEPYQQTLLKRVTIVQTDRNTADSKGSVQRSIYQRELDFSGFCLSLEDLENETGTLCFRVYLPSQWDLGTCKNMMEETLRFQILLDHKETDAFRKRTVSLVSEDPYVYEVRYHECILSNKQWNSIGNIQIVPYYVDISEVLNEQTMKTISLKDGDTFRYTTTGSVFKLPSNQDFLTLSNYSHMALPELALDIEWNASPALSSQSASIMKTVTVWDEFYEQNEKEGYYEGENQTRQPHGSYCNKPLDFTGSSFTLQRFCLSPSGPDIEVHWNSPASWSDVETRSFRTHLGFLILVDGIEVSRYDVAAFINRISHWPDETNRADDFSDLYFTLYPLGLKYKELQEKHQISIVPYYVYYTRVNRKNPVYLSEEPVIDAGWLDYSSEIIEKLDWLTITIDLDETIFNAGL